ncbi:MAG: hypothetical protein CVU61_13760 [Deltaproteobacteria bacterium HGW-Deltaproteobacteria-19]|jgi:hypothetical protein|nr:MAG: hypothetical protein CVU61_13760 [Deltaproteobacteria bacterium HGW-Deltaproteobacteria-19]
MSGNVLRAACAAFLSGRGYAARTDFIVPGTDIRVDVAAVLPRMRDLKMRLKRGFVPTGILHPLIGAGWVTVTEIVRRTGYPAGHVAAVLEEAAGERWIDLDFQEPEPRCRIRDYRPPAKECLLAFDGTERLAEKLERLEALAGCYSRAQFVFPYDLDEKTTETLAGLGAGIVRYHREHGVFQELVPAESLEIDDPGRFALIVEYVLYEHIWIRTGEVL